MKKYGKIAGTIKWITVVLLVEVLVFQFTPFWKYDGKAVSIASYLWFPDDNKDFEEAYKAELSDKVIEEFKKANQKEEEEDDYYIPEEAPVEEESTEESTEATTEESTEATTEESTEATTEESTETTAPSTEDTAATPNPAAETQAVTREVTKTPYEIAKEIFNEKGDWGVGAARKAKLEAAGYSYEEVQSLVNAMMYGTTQTEPQQPAQPETQEPAQPEVQEPEVQEPETQEPEVQEPEVQEPVEEEVEVPEEEEEELVLDKATKEKLALIKQIKVDDIVTLAICQLVASIVGILLYIRKKERGAMAALAPIIAGGAGVLACLTKPVYQVGVVCNQLLGISGGVLILGVVMFAASIIKIVTDEE